MTRITQRGGPNSGSDFFTPEFILNSPVSKSTDASQDAFCPAMASHTAASNGLQGSQTSDVRTHNRARSGACDEYQQLKVLSMGRQKAVIKARREAKRVLRRDSR
ncbi:MAG: hypothetical protein LBU96_06600, partial [Yokenella regensburgei]|nr:hypothetical protein [Yokenella regensburgei]